jgi:coenzyme F420-reducing hydrogenase beta subunit
MLVGSVGALEGWNSVFIRTGIGEQYFDMVRRDMEIMEDPKPGLEFAQKIIDRSARTMLSILQKFARNSALRQEFAMRPSETRKY